MNPDKILSEKFSNNKIEIVRYMTPMFVPHIRIMVDGVKVGDDLCVQMRKAIDPAITDSNDKKDEEILNKIISDIEKYLAEKV